MSFWTILSCCFSSKATQEDNIRPRELTHLNGKHVSALFDTGSASSLVDSKYFNLLSQDKDEAPPLDCVELTVLICRTREPMRLRLQ